MTAPAPASSAVAALADVAAPAVVEVRGDDVTSRLDPVQLRRLARAGARTVRVATPLPLDDAADVGHAAVVTLLWLQTVEGSGLDLVWEAAGPGLADVSLWTHLSPPANDASWAAAWRDAHVRGTHYRRRGPGWFHVVRWSGARRRITLVDDPVEVDRMSAVLAAGSLPRADDAAETELVRAQVLARVGERVLVPATPMLRWPVPVWAR